MKRHLVLTSLSLLLPAAFLLILLLIFLQRIWGLGITINDDAQWLLFSHMPSQNPIQEMAVRQGRLWIFLPGSLMLHVLFWDGTTYAELLKSGSFSIFFIAFFVLVSVYINRQVAYLAAILCIGFLVIRWESVNAYPLLSFPSMTLFVISVIAARIYSYSGKTSWAAVSFFAFFVSLFNQEGVTVLLCALYPVFLAVNPVFIDFTNSRRKILGWIWVIASGTYALVALGWTNFHPTTYDGHVLAHFDISNAIRFLRVLLSFVSSGSILYEFLEPYRVIFTDTVAQTQTRVVYGLGYAVRGIFASRIAIVTGILLTFSAALVLLRQQKSVARVAGLSPLLLAIFIGSMVAVIPIVPVAMTEKYQMFFDLGVRSYYLTTISHFGTSLVLAAVIIAIVEHFEGRRRRIISSALAIAIGVLGAATCTQNLNVVTNMSSEAARWRIFTAAIAHSREAGIDLHSVWAPRFASGSWYAVLPSSYWKDYAKYVLATDVDFEISDKAKLRSTNRYFTLDYMPLKAGSLQYQATIVDDSGKVVLTFIK